MNHDRIIAVDLGEATLLFVANSLRQLANRDQTVAPSGVVS
jgi:hypothetical protein